MELIAATSKDLKVGKHIHQQKYRKDTRYQVKILKRGVGRRKDTTDNFVGRVIQETKHFIVLKNKNGIKESFLKVDFAINAYEIKELN